MKNDRQNRILTLIREQKIETQSALADALIKEGFPVTQATVSRDIRQLHLVKRPDEEGRFVYVYPEESVRAAESKEKFNRVFKDGCVHVEHAQNLLVIKTVSGMAMAVAAAMDAIGFEEIVGTIAGDDTVMSALHSAEEAARLEEKLKIMAGLR